MPRHVVICLMLAVILGCREQSTMTSLESPMISAALLDGGHGGNPHFFFLPPIAPTPTRNGPFNPRLVPVVEICSALEAPCAAGHVLATLGPVRVQDTTQYHVNWVTSPLNLSPGTSVRIIVRVGTAHILGFADVDVVSNTPVNGQPTGNFRLVAGQTLPIKFRIEQGALTPDQTCTDCAEQTISTRTGSATVVTSTHLAGAFFPQGALPQDVTVIIEATPPAEGQACIPVALDQFPGCYTYSTDPGPTTFNTQVTAGICVESDGLTPDQLRSLILYQLDVVTSGEFTTDVLIPLENAPAAFLPCNALAARRGSRGLLARVREALVRLLVPAPLNAAHLGVGGLTGSFSKIGWGLPPTMSKVAGTDGESAPVGTAVASPPGVQLTNSHGKPVQGLPITFTVVSGGGSITVPRGVVGTAGPLIVRTGSDGVAALGNWTLGSSPGANTLTASQIGALGSPLTFTATGTAGLTLTKLSAGWLQACGVTISGAAFCWGDNTHGELGNGTTAGAAAPTPVSGGLTFATISAGINYTCGVTTTGAAYCWGDNTFGQLGNGTTTGATAPVAVSGGLTFATVSTASLHTCGLTTGGTAYCWGDAARGELGNGTSVGPQLCPQGSSCFTTPVPVSGGLTFVTVSAGNAYTCGVTTSGAAYCWGFNLLGELGNGTTAGTSAPVRVSGGLTLTTVVTGAFSACGVTTGGAAYCWGDNRDGQLGIGTTTVLAQCNGFPCSTMPLPVSGGLTFGSVSAFAGRTYSCGLTTAGAAYCWGSNAYGELGFAPPTGATAPAAVSGGLTFATISTGQTEACGVTTSGAAYCWGGNFVGQLGIGTTTGPQICSSSAGTNFPCSPTPVPVSGGLTFAGVVSNRNAGTVSGFRIDQTTGALTAMHGSPFAAGLDASLVAVAR